MFFNLVTDSGCESRQCEDWLFCHSVTHKEVLLIDLSDYKGVKSSVLCFRARPAGVEENKHVTSGCRLEFFYLMSPWYAVYYGSEWNLINSLIKRRLFMKTWKSKSRSPLTRMPSSKSDLFKTVQSFLSVNQLNMSRFGLDQDRLFWSDQRSAGLWIQIEIKVTSREVWTKLCKRWQKVQVRPRFTSAPVSIGLKSASSDRTRREWFQQRHLSAPPALATVKADSQLDRI